MKKITLFLVVCAFAFTGKAQVIFDETFTQFPASTDVTGIPTNGWLNWASNIGPTASDFRTVLNPAMAYSDAGGLTALSGVGNSLWNDYTGLSGNNYITYKEFSSTPIETGSVYLSYLFQAIKQGGSQGEVFGVTDSIHRGAMRTWIGKGTDATSYRLGLTRSSGASADIQYIPSKTYAYGTIYFIVLKYDFTSQIASIYINPAVGSSSEPTPEVTDGTLGTARTSLRYLMVRNGGSNKAYYNASSVRVANSWTDAVAAFKSELPKVSTPTIGSAGSVDTEFFTANWTPVANAIGYTIYVYNGSTLFKKFEVEGGTTSNAVVTGLISNTAFTYKVLAKGDNINFASSELSASSASFVTVNGLTSMNPDFGDGSWGDIYENSAAEPATGSFPVFSTNGYDVIHGLCSHTSKTGPNGEIHAYSIKLDKGSAGGMIVLPSMKSISRVEIHAWTGTALRPFVLQELQSDGTWSAGEIFTTNDVANDDNIFVSSMTRTIGTKLRIINTGGGAVNIGQITIESSANGLNDLKDNAALYGQRKTISSSQTGTLTVYNLQGVQLLKSTIQNNLVTTLASGMYVARLTTENGLVVTRKIMIQ